MSMGGRKRVGFIAAWEPSAIDVRELILALRQRYDVLIFSLDNDEWFRQQNFEVRKLEQQNRSLSNSLWSYLFLLFGRIPVSKNNFFITGLYRISGQSGVRKIFLTLLLYFRVSTPNFLSFDFFIRRLKSKDGNNIDDIDLFFFITELPCKFFLSRLVKEKKPIVAYVHSWDHAPKHDTMSNLVDRYMVWNESLRQDLIDLQEIEPERIECVGSTQFSFIHRFLSQGTTRTTRRYSFDYFLFAFSTAEPRMVLQEVLLVEAIAEILQNIDTRARVIVRRYPMLRDDRLYRSLLGVDNIVFDDSIDRKEDRLVMTEAEILTKLSIIEGARGVIHVGSTIGFESCYLDTPVLQIHHRGFDWLCPSSSRLHLKNFIEAYQVKKYLLLESYPNVVNNLVELETAMRGCLERPEDYLAYNHAVRSQVSVQSLESVSHNICQALENVAQGTV